jgi:hypothetical protein
MIIVIPKVRDFVSRDCFGFASQRKIRVASYFHLTQEFIGIDDLDVDRVRFLKGAGFSDIDALHIALAEKAKVDYFISCDDDIINIYKKHKNMIKVKVLSLVEFIGLGVI